MGRPAKIRKKKSFMFTTKHQSFTGIMGLVIAAITITATITIVINAFNLSGKAPVKYGIIGMISAVLNVIGIFSGIDGVNEKDAYITPPIVAIVVNGIMVVLWVVVLILANK